MNTPSNAVSESQVVSQTMAPAAVTRPYYWSIRRELWEYRFLYIAPIGVAAVFLIVFSGATIYLPQKLRALSDATQRQHHMSSRYELAAALIMGTAWLVGLYYTLEALYGERRDRSILFWKSLPVSDFTAVLSKLTIAMVI
ncbi:MAG: ABC transporter permease, partial [Actinomycetota bacterium]